MFMLFQRRRGGWKRELEIARFRFWWNGGHRGGREFALPAQVPTPGAPEIPVNRRWWGHLGRCEEAQRWLAELIRINTTNPREMSKLPRNT